MNTCFPILFVALGLSVAACSASSGSQPQPGDDAFSDGSDVSVAPAAVRCGSGGEQVFPGFDRTCAVDGDCFVALHAVDCCGTHAAMGLATSQREAFDEAESRCDAMLPACTCASQGIVTDDGVAAGVANDHVGARCVAGRCRAVPIGVGCGSVICSDGQVCVQGCGQSPIDGGSVSPAAQCMDVPTTCMGTPAACGCLGTAACQGQCAGALATTVRCVCP